MRKIKEGAKLPEYKDEAFTAVTIAHNCFDNFYKAFNGAGCIAVYDLISKAAGLFIEIHKEVKNWEEFCLVNGFSDWEEYLIEWILAEFLPVFSAPEKRKEL